MRRSVVGILVLVVVVMVGLALFWVARRHLPDH